MNNKLLLGPDYEWVIDFTLGTIPQQLCGDLKFNQGIDIDCRLSTIPEYLSCDWIFNQGYCITEFSLIVFDFEKWYWYKSEKLEILTLSNLQYSSFLVGVLDWVDGFIA